MTTALAALFWLAAAVLVLMMHRIFAPVSPAASLTVKCLTVVLAAFLYNRIAAPDSTIDHALLVGALWLLLATATEVTMSIVTRHGWFTLIGSPAHVYARDILLAIWVAAPALFARYQ